MSSFSTPALVLRRSDWSDYDRMVTLFTPGSGRVECVARGCRRPKSPLVNAVELFTSGEYQIYRSGERNAIEQCQIRESFLPLRTDYGRLTHGVYWLKLLDTGVMRDLPYEELFLLSLTALAHLAYSDLPPEMLTLAFELHFMSRMGYPPRANACVLCGKPIEADARFDERLGGTVCLSCPSNAPRISNGARRILFKLPRTRFENVPKLLGHPDWPEAARLFRPYVQSRMQLPEKFLPALVSPGPLSGI